MTLARQIIVTVTACLGALVLAGVAAVVMLEGVPLSLETAVPPAAMTVPMIGVIAFWLVCRALGAALEPIRTFIFGALVVYGTLYFVGRAITFTDIGERATLAIAGFVIFAMAFAAVRSAAQGRTIR